MRKNSFHFNYENIKFESDAIKNNYAICDLDKFISYDFNARKKSEISEDLKESIEKTIKG